MDNKLAALQERIIKLDRNLKAIAGSFAGDNLETDDIYGAIVEDILTHSDPNDSNARILTRAKWVCGHYNDHALVVAKHTQPELDVQVSETDDLDELDWQETTMKVTTTPENAVIDAETQAMIARVVATMEPRHQQILRLLVCGNSKAEIADQMGVPRPRVSQLIKDIRNTITRIDPNFGMA